MITVNMDKARDIQRNRVRAERSKQILALDVEYMRLLEQGKDTTEIVTKKQKMRDAPASNAFDDALTPDQLKKITLESLIKG